MNSLQLVPGWQCRSLTIKSGNDLENSVPLSGMSFHIPQRIIWRFAETAGEWAFGMQMTGRCQPYTAVWHGASPSQLEAGQHRHVFDADAGNILACWTCAWLRYLRAILSFPQCKTKTPSPPINTCMDSDCRPIKGILVSFYSSSTGRYVPQWLRPFCLWSEGSWSEFLPWQNGHVSVEPLGKALNPWNGPRCCMNDWPWAVTQNLTCTCVSVSHILCENERILKECTCANGK